MRLYDTEEQAEAALVDNGFARYGEQWLKGTVKARIQRDSWKAKFKIVFS